MTAGRCGVEHTGSQCSIPGVQRDSPGECEIGDWVMMMEAPGEWESRRSPVQWGRPDGKPWHFAFTEVPAIDEEEGEVGTVFVWIRYDPAMPCPRPPRWLFQTEESDPADWWKSK